MSKRHRRSPVDRRVVVSVLAALCVSAAPADATTINDFGDSGTLLVWGDNSQGQLGDGTKTDALTPKALAGQWSAVAAGKDHTLAVAHDMTVWAWGNNSHGQLGDGSSAQGHKEPRQVRGLTGIFQVEAGNEFSLARRWDGSVWAWGSNSDGQLGNGQTADSALPVEVRGLPEPGYDGGVRQIAAGDRHGLARTADGDVFAWGDNSRGQVGDGTTTDRSTAVQLDLLEAPLTVAVYAGGAHSLALSQTGDVFSWAANDRGQLGDGTTLDRGRPAPVIIARASSALVNAAAGSAHSLALADNGTIWAWGDNERGQLGSTTGTGSSRAVPAPVDNLGPPLTPVARVPDAGDFFSFAITSGGFAGDALMAWGDNSDGQLGTGDTNQRNKPVRVLLPPWVSSSWQLIGVVGGGAHSLAIAKP